MDEYGKQLLQDVDFGPSYAGLTCFYTLYNADGTVFQARTSTGVVEAPAGSGMYQVLLTALIFTTEFHGAIYWDLGASYPGVRARQNINLYAPGAKTSDMLVVLDDLMRILGLLGRNVGMRDPIYDPSNNLLSYNLTIYDTLDHATTNDGLTGVLAIYHVANVYDPSGNITSFVTTQLT